MKYEHEDGLKESYFGPKGEQKKRLVFWLRWGAALPAGLAAGVLVTFPIHWVVLLGTFLKGQEDGLSLFLLPPETLERLGTALFVPLTIIYCAAKVAPAYRVHTAGVLVPIYSLGLGAAMTYSVARGAYTGWAWLELATVIFLGLSGAITGLYLVYRKERNGR